MNIANLNRLLYYYLIKVKIFILFSPPDLKYFQKLYNKRSNFLKEFPFDEFFKVMFFLNIKE